MNRRTFGLTAAAALLPAPVLSQDSDPLASSRRRLSEEGLYLPHLEALRIEAGKSPDPYGYYPQMLSQFRASVGDEIGALGSGAEFAAVSDAIRSRVAATTAEDAIGAVVRESRGRRVVILNESHHVSRCRAFANDVALALRAEGFSILAGETFDPSPAARFDERMAGGMPVTTDVGFYTSDPVFAELLRTARAAGMRLAAYEQRDDQAAPNGAQMAALIAAREEAEATNLAALMARHADARLLIYCGGSHGAKIPQQTPDGPRSWMAARLREKTGVDPLSIVQAGFPRPSPQGESPIVTAIVEKYAPTRPIIVKGADGGPFLLDKSYDMAVYHPRLPYQDGRPGWLAAGKDRRRVLFELAEPPPAGSLLQAALAGPPNVVPSDQYPASDGARQAIFFLRPGEYEVRLESMAGRRELGRITA